MTARCEDYVSLVHELKMPDLDLFHGNIEYAENEVARNQKILGETLEAIQDCERMTG